MGLPLPLPPPARLAPLRHSDVSPRNSKNPLGSVIQMDDSQDEGSAEWSWVDGKPCPTEVYIDSAMSQHMGDVFLSLSCDGDRIGIFLTESDWDAIDHAARVAIEERRVRSEQGWT